MQDHDDLLELAHLCVWQAQIAHSKEAADELRQMAREYREQAAARHGSRLPAAENP